MFDWKEADREETVGKTYGKVYPEFWSFNLVICLTSQISLILNLDRFESKWHFWRYEGWLSSDKLVEREKRVFVFTTKWDEKITPKL